MTYEGGTFTGVNSHTTDTNDYSVSDGWYGAEMNGGYDSLTCAGDITVHIDWVGDPNKRSSVLVLDTACIAKWDSASGVGACNNGLGHAGYSWGMHGQVKGTDSGLVNAIHDHYEVIQDPGAHLTRTISASASASNATPSPAIYAKVRCQVVATPIDVVPAGTIYDDGTYNCLPSQVINYSITSGPYSVSNYSWHAGTGVEWIDHVIWGTPGYGPLGWYFSSRHQGFPDPIDGYEQSTFRTMYTSYGTDEVSCDIDISISGIPIGSATPKKDIEVQKPDLLLAIVKTGGSRYEPNSTSPVSIDCRDVTTNGPGIEFKCYMSTPELFSTNEGDGEYSLAQLCKLNYVLKTDLDEQGQIDEDYKLDNIWTYPSYESDYSWPANAVMGLPLNYASDEPYIGFISYLWDVQVNNQFKMFLVWKAPDPTGGGGADWIASYKVSWTWNAHATYTSGAWQPITGTGVTQGAEREWPDDEMIWDDVNINNE